MPSQVRKTMVALLTFLLTALLTAYTHAAFHAEPPQHTLWTIQHATAFDDDATSIPLEFTIILKDNADGLSKLKQRTLDVSDPTSSSYGQHLSIAEINTLTAPPIQNINTITTWLKRNNIENINVQTSGTTRINFQTKSNLAAKLFSTTFFTLIV